ncbi:glycosyltransferase family 4 protein [Planococcus sp. S3-L1]|uniref:glycosyltransferase family 4 protein n=1 Tax=Planococcus sp. S3-L1 TaxID=3046200 RepID=UPI0024BA945F|nr:glycosyltransferase family 4 protein [Planococcus sp. S3-L1]MDJ0332957.1 glycosyltransferase family 4 protein [Planococcus sp. S3-L1]
MKVCHLTSVHSHLDTRILLKECNSLAEAGFDVYYIVPGVTNMTLGSVKILGVELSDGNRLKRMTRTVKKVYKEALNVDADIYHFHDPELLPIGLKLKKKGKKVIYDVHEDVPQQILNKSWLPFKSQKFVSKIFAIYEIWAVKQFDLVIAATPFINNRFVKQDIKSISVNNYPIIKEFYSKVPIVESRRKSICYVGGINKYRGIEEMVKALELTEDINLLLAGKFTTKQEKQKVSEYKGWNKVCELGFLNRQEVNQVYNKSFAGLVVLHPRKNYIDSLPVKMFEYMAAGIPVIASDFPLWRKIVEENNCGICVNPVNIVEIAKTIEFLFNNPKVAQEMGENGIGMIKTKYNWKIESEKLIQAYKKLAK